MKARDTPDQMHSPRQWSLMALGPGGLAIDVNASTVLLQNSSVIGGKGGLYLYYGYNYIYGPGGPAIEATGGSRIIATKVGAQQEIQVGFGSLSQHAVALLDSTFEHSAVQVGKIKAEGSSRVISPTIPHLALALVSPFNLGALAWFTVGGEPQRACVVVVSHGWNPIDFPFGTLFPDGRGWFHSVSAVLDANGRAAILTAVGRDPVSLGQVLTCQAVEISPTLELRLSTPLAGIVSVPPF